MGCNICIAILKLPDANITKRVLKNCWQGNKDGGGLMYVDDENHLIIEKGFFGFRRIYRRIRYVERIYPKSKIVIHFRIATSGIISEYCCHPFSVTNDIGFVHNGILSGMGNAHISDTQEFNFSVLKKLPKKFLCSREIIDKLDFYARKSVSKFIFLHADNYHLICNEGLGYWEDGVWFSNAGYKWDSLYSASSYIYDGEYGHNEDYLSTTYKKCELCGTYDAINRMNWDTESCLHGGWLCNTCNYMYDEDDYASKKVIKSVDDYDVLDDEKFKLSDDEKTLQRITKCKMCNQIENIQDCIILDNGVAYCGECWCDLIQMFPIDCPICSCTVTLKDGEICPTCDGQLELKDYADQYESLEFN